MTADLALKIRQKYFPRLIMTVPDNFQCQVDEKMKLPNSMDEFYCCLKKDKYPKYEHFFLNAIGYTRSDTDGIYHN